MGKCGRVQDRSDGVGGWPRQAKRRPGGVAARAYIIRTLVLATLPYTSADFSRPLLISSTPVSAQKGMPPIGFSSVTENDIVQR